MVEYDERQIVIDYNPINGYIIKTFEVNEEGVEEILKVFSYEEYGDKTWRETLVYMLYDIAELLGYTPDNYGKNNLVIHMKGKGRKYVK